MKKMIAIVLSAGSFGLAGSCEAWAEQDSSAVASAKAEWWKPYSPPCVERENVFEFTEKPKVKNLGNDKYEITFAVKGNCDVTVGIVDSGVDATPSSRGAGGSGSGGGAASTGAAEAGRGVVVRHLASGVLGPNAPAPFQKNSLKQTLYWNGKDDLDVYHKMPEKLKVRVMLGLKPVFDKRLGGTSPHNLPGYIRGLAIGPDAAYVFIVGTAFTFEHVYIRKFDLEGKYLCSLLPPPATLPESKLGGMAFVEYEPGKRAVHGPDPAATVAGGAGYLPPLDGHAVLECLPALVGDRLFFANAGHVPGSPGSFLYYIYTDGSTDARGINGIPLAKGVMHNSPKLAASPDGKRLYLLGTSGTYRWSAGGEAAPATCIYVISPEGKGPAVVWAGEPNKPGSDNQHFGRACGLDCDAEGRVYVTDVVNNRLQIFSPEGKHLKTIPVDRPGLVCVRRKTGAIYVQHGARVEGRSVSRVTKFVSFDEPKEEFHADGLDGLMALDQWSNKPRLWLALKADRNALSSVTVWEERDRKLEKVLDFEAEARKEAGRFGRWNGTGQLSSSHAVCDPVREKLYYAQGQIFDLATGKYEGSLHHPGSTDDIAFDKYGYLHGHFNPCFFMQGVGRFDPVRQQQSGKPEEKAFTYAECPYDYGIEKERLLGVLPVKDQLGSKGFQDGLGVNMRGEVAEECNIYYVPKMEDEAGTFVSQGPSALTSSGVYNEERSYSDILRGIKEAERRGDQSFSYSIRRVPGIPLMGGTVWTFNRNGELRKQCAVIAGELVDGVQIDEDLAVYFVNRRQRLYGDKPFLAGRAGHFGAAESTTPPVWTMIKTKPDTQCRVLLKNAPIPLDILPDRPMDVSGGWVEGAEWLYAGASPVVPGGCSCPAQRLHLDWYKRSYVPEMYRHSFALLDTNGNLIMHVGRYGNFDSAPGGKDGCKPGETDIGMTAVRYIGGTDNYLAFEDWGERLVVLKLDYQAEESVGIGNQ